MNKSYKFRAMPNAEQRVLFAKTVGCARFVYNRMLADKIACYKETGKMRADLICFVDEEYNTDEDLLLFDPDATWKKTRLAGGTYTMKEILKPVFIRGECKYNSPSVQEIAEFCRQEKDTLWDETKRLFNPHKVYVDLSRKLYDTKAELLNSVNM